MKFLIVLSAVVAVTLAKPGYLAGGIASLGLGPAVYAAPAAFALPAPPQAPQDTPEVQAARAEHLAAVARASSGSAPAPAPAEAPQPVQDTPEVASAKAAHALAHATAAAIAPAGIQAAPGFIAAPAAYAAPGIIAAAPTAYIGPQHVPILTAQGVPLDTPEVQAARAADAIAHINAKAGLLG